MTMWTFGEPRTELEIASVEKSIGHRFPEDFRRHLMSNDGALTEEDLMVSFSNGLGERDSAAVNVFPLSTGAGELSIEKVNDASWDWPMGMVVFGDDGGGNFFAFDYGHDGALSVCFLDRKMGDVQSVRLAGSFDELCAMGTVPHLMSGDMP